MSPPPVKLPPPGHRPMPVLTKDELLQQGGHCPFSGGFCTDSHGGMWDCSNPNDCVSVGDGTAARRL
jgi:hypothetical protein